ncbi:PrsW family intramembrane metalloprotease [Brachybacterium saurashtrense]|uniref:Protease PrsW n=1 Tax=Brachybacterium saurashtrense TaxID=556288 RepID=A0A345YLI8_9MICO|nr:PrsW family intramembrane metalloprotease [Brachybacterium saurashtrense]AXK44790.1 protease PrsW [Brachybacterium saurashtrense]RRR23402.1 protease PrsW [Brachybacterium saurashtrense]
MSQPPPPPQSPHGDRSTPRARPRPGAAAPAADAPEFQARPRFQDYGNPRAYDTSVRRASGLTAARFAPAQIHRPEAAQPQSAWSTQMRRAQEVTQVAAKPPTVSILVWIALIALGFALLVVLGLFFLQFVVLSSANPVWWPVTAFLAGISLTVIALTMLIADRWDPQPLPLLLIAVFWGAAIAVGISYVLNTVNRELVYAVTGSDSAADFAGAVISAPLVEETSKGAGLLLLMLLARRYFNGPLDGLIYGALLGGGFAFTENILYYSRQLEEFGAFGVALLFVIRGVLNIFGHAIYVSLTGVIVGYVVRKWGSIMGFLVFLPALIPGMLLHSAWNLAATLGGGLVVLLVMSAVQALISLCWLILIGVLMWDESRLTRVRLGDYANQGWLTHEEVDMLATWKGRREGKRWAAQIGAKPVMKRFIRESADLASIRQRLLADGANPKVAEIERTLLERLSRNRQELLAAAR